MRWSHRFVTLLFFSIFTLFHFSAVTLAQTESTSPSKGILFYGQGCPHCAKVEEFLEQNNLSDVVVKKEIYHNPDNAQEFNRICEEQNIDMMNRGVPFLFVDNTCFIGDKEIINYFQTKLPNSTSPSIKKSALTPTSQPPPTSPSQNQHLTIPMVMGAALVDAINPCAFAVLLILMMTVLATGKRKRALYSGLAFSLAIFLAYLLMGLGLYSVVASVGVSQVFMNLIGVLAIILGLLNLKDFFWYGKGFLMEVPLSWRPRMKKLIRGVTSPVGAFLIGFLVSLFLLPCTSGPYIVIIGMLGSQTTFATAVKLLILYNLIFISPMILISLATYFGMNVKKAEETRQANLRWLHLIAGIIMLVMGVYLLFYL